MRLIRSGSIGAERDGTVPSALRTDRSPPLAAETGPSYIESPLRWKGFPVARLPGLRLLLLPSGPLLGLGEALPGHRPSHREAGVV